MIDGDPLSNINIDNIEFVDVTKENVLIVKQLNDRIFDICYQPQFYKHILHHGKRNFNKLLKYGSTAIGVVLCKHFYIDENLDADMKLPDGFNGLPKVDISRTPKAVTSESPPDEETEDAETPAIRDSMIYIAAFGLIPLFRCQGIGKLMIKHVLKLAEETPGVKYIGLHVHSTNKAAIKFYKRHGFSVAQLLETYYLRLEPRSAYLLALIPKALTSHPEKPQLDDESKPQE